jgi:hypothetical protein
VALAVALTGNAALTVTLATLTVAGGATGHATGHFYT